MSLLFLIFPPSFLETLAEDCELNQIPVAPVAEDVLLAASFFLVTALLVVCDAPSVKLDSFGTDFAEVDRVEAVAEEGHFGISAVALAPILLLSDERAGGRDAVAPIDFVDAHHSDGSPVLERDDESNIVLVPLTHL